MRSATFFASRAELAQPISQIRVLGHGAAKEDKLPAIGFLPRRSPLKPPSDAAGLFFKFPEPMAMSRVPDSGRVAGGMCRHEGP